MPNTARVLFPPGYQNGFSPAGLTTTRGTPPLLPDANNSAVVDLSVYSLETLLAAGFTIAPAYGTTAQRPTAFLTPGQFYLDSTLNKPIWRRADNLAWIDATGASV